MGDYLYFCNMLQNRNHKLYQIVWRRLGGLVLLAVLLYSCASIGRLEGGPYDEQPPRFVAGTPAPGQLHANKKKISIEFDEFIKLEKPNEKIVISPPQAQQPVIKASSKKVVVTLEDSLKPNTTYTIDFGDAIQDNNEGNPLEAFTYTFSTGDKLDTMVVSGTLLNAENLEPIKGMLVGMHSNLNDSAFTSLPFERVGRTDSRGHFFIRGIAPGEYRLFALKDADQDFKYSQPAEIIAFHDSLIIPTMEQRQRQDTLWQDSLTVDTVLNHTYTHFLPDNVMLRAFKEQIYVHRQVRSERPTFKEFSLYFTAPADTLPVLKGLNFDERNALLVEQTTGRNDTLHYWIKDSLIYQMDTLKLSLTYLYTDSLNRLVPRTDTLNLVSKERRKTEKELEKERKEWEKELERKRKRGDTDTIRKEFLPMDVYAPSTLDVYDYLTLTFKEPLSALDTSAFHLTQQIDSLWEPREFQIIRDSLDHKIYNLFPAQDWEFGGNYALTIDSMAVRGLYGLHTDRIKKEFKIKKPEDYGAIFFNVAGVETAAFVELLDGQDKVLRSVPVVDGKADFYFLNPGKYGARLIVDGNANGIWDTGCYEEQRQPEEVYYYWQVLELKANFELTQTWEVMDRPLDKQKPEELKKQKPDEDKKKRRNERDNNRNNNRNNRNYTSNSGRGYSY